MIYLTRLNQESILLNEDQIKYIAFIPESKVTMMNGEFFLVRESGEEIINRVIEFRRRIVVLE